MECRNRYYVHGKFLLVPLILLLCGISYAPIVAADAPPLEATMISLDHQNFPFIYLSVAVNRYGEGISTLGKNNFQVTENGVLQTDYFDVTPPAAGGGVRTVDIVFLMDNSGSMEGEQSAVREHVIAFVDELKARGVHYQLGLCRFGAFENGGNPIIEGSGVLTGDAEYFKNDVWNRNVVNGGFEPGWDALYESATGFAFRGGSQKVFILITDETPTDNGNVGTHTQEEAISILQDHYVTTFALIELSDAHAVSDYGVIAEQTNGAYYDVLEPLDGILDYISGLIPNNYRVTYKSSRPVFDGVERHVVVTASYQGDQATCDGTYTPGSAPRIRRTQDTLALHDQSWAAGTTFAIKAEITDDVTPYVQSAKLYYRTTGDATYVSTPMTHSSDIWTGTILGGAVKTPGLDYYISATDGESTATSPPVDPRIRPHQLAILPNRAPQITHTPVTTAMANTPVTITAEVVDTTNVLDSIELWYRKVGQLIFKTNGQMTNIGGDTYQDTIPTSYVTEAGVEYCILAYDDLGIGNWHGSFFDPHVITVSSNQPPNTKIESAVFDESKGTAKFTWSGSDDTTPAKDLLYCYRLRKDSSYSGWSTWSTSTTKTYTNLSPGSYRFQVKAKDADEAIQPDSATWEFAIGEAPSEFWVQVYNTGSTLAIRKTPGTKNKPADDVIKRVPDGWVLKVLRTDGTPEAPDGFTWWQVEEGEYEPAKITGWVASEYLKKLTSVSSPPASPDGLTKVEWEAVADEAVQWAKDKEGSDEWGKAKNDGTARCAKFVANAFGQAAAGYNADGLAEYLKGKGLLYPNPEKGIYGNPPRGALIFFKPAKINEWYGHVGIYLGNGEMVNQYVDIRIMLLTDYSTSIGYKGWAYPPEDWLPKQEAAGTITGRVIGSGVGGISGATLLLEPSPFPNSPVTDADGYFSFSTPAGTYDITASAEGYESWIETSVVVAVGETTEVPLFVLLEAPEWRQGLLVGDILYDPHALLGNLGHVGIYVDHGLTVDPRMDTIVHSIGTWDSRHEVYILRVNSSAEIRIAAAKLAQQIAQHETYTYDWRWIQKNPDPDATWWYCSELVWAVYWEQEPRVNIEWNLGNSNSFYLPGPVEPYDIYRDIDTERIGAHCDGEPGCCLPGCPVPQLRPSFNIFCPADLVVTDPDGLVISKATCTIPEAVYLEDDRDNDGRLGDAIYLPELKLGIYSIQVEPEPGAGPNDVYTLSVYNRHTHTEVVLADSVPISDIPDEPYQIEISNTADGPIPPSGSVILGPNPISSNGGIFWLELPQDTVGASLKVFSISGRLVFETPIETGASRFPNAGTWNPVDQDGIPLANGPYVYVLIADGKVIGQGKMVIQR